jgi:hypothetical protein
MKYTSNTRGVTPVLVAILAVALLAVIGFAVYRANRTRHKDTQPVSASPMSSTKATPSEAPPANSYQGWKTFTSTKEGLTFKYPADWQLTVADGVNTRQATLTSVSLKSPLRGGNPNVFAVSFIFNNDMQQSVAAKVLEVASLHVPGSQQHLYLITSDTDGGRGLISMNLSEKAATVGQTQATLQMLSQKDGKSPITMGATLMKPGAQQASSTGLDAFKDHPDYASLQKLFRSLAY